MTDEPLPLEGSAFQKKVKADKNKLVIYLAGEITREFGPPPIITGERLEDFNQILYGVIEDKCPTLHLEKMHVWDIATSIFFGRRIDLVTRYILNRKIGEVLAVQKQRRALQAEQAQTKKADDNSLAEIRGAPELTETQKRDYELKTAIEDTLEDVKMIMDRAEVEAAQ